MTVRGPQLHLRRLSCWSSLLDDAHLVSVLKPIAEVKRVRARAGTVPVAAR